MYHFRGRFYAQAVISRLALALPDRLSIHLDMIQLSPKSHVPLHIQAEQWLRDLVRRDEYTNGKLLPDELTLALKLGVSRGTLRGAIGRLVQEGVIERKAGVGTRVCKPAGESGIEAWRSFSREMAAKGIRVENFRCELSHVETSPAAINALQIKQGIPLWRLERVRGWDGQPVLYSCSWFHPRLRLSGSEDFSKPLYEVIEKATGITAVSAREEFTALVADDQLSVLLEVHKGEPLLRRCHTVFDAGGRSMEFAEVYYVSSRFALTLDLQRKEKGS